MYYQTEPKVIKAYDLLNLSGFLGNITIRELHLKDNSIQYRVYNIDSQTYIDYDAKMAIRNIAQNNNPFLAVMEEKIITCIDFGLSVHDSCHLGTVVRGELL